MFDKLEDLVKRLDEVMQELSEPDVVSDQNRFRNLMKEQNELAPIVEKYKEYKEAKQTIEDSVEMLEEEHDEEMRELLKEELSEAKKNVEQYEEELKDSPSVTLYDYDLALNLYYFTTLGKHGKRCLKRKIRNYISGTAALRLIFSICSGSTEPRNILI